MKLELDFLLIQTFLGFLLAMFRVQGFFLSAPIFSRSSIPVLIKIGISFLYCLWFYDAIFANGQQILSYHPAIILILVFIEFTIGYLFGFLVNLVFDAILTFAHLLGTQFGMSSATVFNASLASPTNPTGIFFSTIAFLYFISFGGLYNISFILKKTFEFIAINDYSTNINLLFVNFAQVFSQIFILSLKFILPLIALMFVVDIFVAIFSKILPQASMFFLIMPNKLILAAIISIIVIVPLNNGLQEYFDETLLGLLDQLFYIN